MVLLLVEITKRLLKQERGENPLWDRAALGDVSKRHVVDVGKHLRQRFSQAALLDVAFR